MSSDFEAELIQAIGSVSDINKRRIIIADKILSLSPEDAAKKIYTLSPEMTAEAMKAVGRRIESVGFKNISDPIEAQRKFISEHMHPVAHLIYRSHSCISPATVDYTNPLHDRFIQRLTDEIDLSSIFDVENWQKMSTTDKNKLLDKILQIQAKEYGIKNAELKTYQDINSHEHGKSNVDDFSAEVALNTASGQPYHMDGKKALTTLIHEAYHAWQGTLANQLIQGEIKKDDPRYSMALIFDASLPDTLRFYSDGSLYIRPEANHELYEKNATEMQARTRSEKIVEALQKKLAEKRVNPKKGSGRGVGQQTLPPRNHEPDAGESSESS